MKASILPLVLFFLLFAVVSSQTTDESILDSDSIVPSEAVFLPDLHEVAGEPNENQIQTEAPVFTNVRRNEPVASERDDFLDSSASEIVQENQVVPSKAESENVAVEKTNDVLTENQGNVSEAKANESSSNEAATEKPIVPDMVAQPAPNNKPQLHHLIRHVPPHLFPLVRPLFFGRHEDNSPESQQFNPHCQTDHQKRTIENGRFEKFFMNPKNHDVMFSVCGQLFPAHRIVIESSSPLLARIVDQFKTDAPQAIINVHIDSFDSFMSLINGDGIVKSDNDKCQQPEFLESFKILLKYFYAGETAFDDIKNLKSALLLINIAKPIVAQSNVENAVVERIGSLMTLDDTAAVHRFAREQGSLNLRKVVGVFIHKNRAQIIARNVTHLPIECDDADLEYVDDYIDSLDVSQTQSIVYITHFMDNCQDFGPKVKAAQDAKNNPFQKSISLYRSNIADLKHLVKLGFITYEILSQELENRLRFAENELESVRIQPHVSIGHQRRIPDMMPAASQNVQKFFRLNPIIRPKPN